MKNCTMIYYKFVFEENERERKREKMIFKYEILLFMCMYAYMYYARISHSKLVYDKIHQNQQTNNINSCRLFLLFG